MLAAVLLLLLPLCGAVVVKTNVYVRPYTTVIAHYGFVDGGTFTLTMALAGGDEDAGSRDLARDLAGIGGDGEDDDLNGFGVVLCTDKEMEALLEKGAAWSRDGAWCPAFPSASPCAVSAKWDGSRTSMVPGMHNGTLVIPPVRINSTQVHTLLAVSCDRNPMDPHAKEGFFFRFTFLNPGGRQLGTMFDMLPAAFAAFLATAVVLLVLWLANVAWRWRKGDVTVLHCWMTVALVAAVPFAVVELAYWRRCEETGYCPFYAQPYYKPHMADRSITLAIERMGFWTVVVPVCMGWIYCSVGRRIAGNSRFHMTPWKMFWWALATVAAGLGCGLGEYFSSYAVFARYGGNVFAGTLSIGYAFYTMGVIDWCWRRGGGRVSQHQHLVATLTPPRSRYTRTADGNHMLLQVTDDEDVAEAPAADVEEMPTAEEMQARLARAERRSPRLRKLFSFLIAYIIVAGMAPLLYSSDSRHPLAWFVVPKVFLWLFLLALFTILGRSHAPPPSYTDLASRSDAADETAAALPRGDDDDDDNLLPRPPSRAARARAREQELAAARHLRDNPIPMSTVRLARRPPGVPTT